MHFYEASLITTKDGLYCQVYSNEHPNDGMLVKPKYIPTDRIESKSLQYRFIGGKKMNRLNLWSDHDSLKEYISQFKEKYPQYIYISPIHNGPRLFFIVPFDQIERVYLPRQGLKELMDMPEQALDKHLSKVYSFVNFILKSGLRLKDLGITYSTLMGHYSSKSDINIVVYGKENFWKLMDYLNKAKNPKLRWKTEQEWLDFHNQRMRYKFFDKNKFLKDMIKKRSEGFFDNTLFVIFAVEKEEASWFRWGSESYTEEGIVKVRGIVSDNFSSVVRPGCYEIKKSEILDGPKGIDIKKIVFHSRDYCNIASIGEEIEACGVLEKVESKNEGKTYYRVVVGYLDAYITDRREKEYIKLI